MDREQEEMQFLGFFGIYGESYKLIFKLRKIFAQITLTLILPLSFIFLAHEVVATILYYRIRYHEFRLYHTKSNEQWHRLSDIVSSEWAVYIVVKVVYFTFLLAFSLLSTSAVVYTVACVYTSREITYKKVMSVVPRVWKRLMGTFLCAFFAFFVYNLAFGLTLIMWRATVEDTKVGGAALVILFILYAMGFVYMTVIWQLASVVSVLEDSYGIKAMIKSKNLIKGKMFVAIMIFLKLNVTLVAINFVFKIFVIYGCLVMDAAQVVGFATLCFLLLLKLFLFGLVVQTVVYFVCKSYHHENIDKSVLSDHLEVYLLGEYVPLKAKDVQMEECA